MYECICMFESTRYKVYLSWLESFQVGISTMLSAASWNGGTISNVNLTLVQAMPQMADRNLFYHQFNSGDSAHPITVLHQYEHALTNVTRQEELDPSLCNGFICGCSGFEKKKLCGLKGSCIYYYLLHKNKLLGEMERPCGSPLSQAIQLWWTGKQWTQPQSSPSELLPQKLQIDQIRH